MSHQALTGVFVYAAPSIASNAYTAAGSPSANLGFAVQGARLNNTGGDPLLYSFDGMTDHGFIAAGAIVSMEHLLAGTGKIWLKRQAGAGANTVHITLWG